VFRAGRAGRAGYALPVRIKKKRVSTCMCSGKKFKYRVEVYNLLYLLYLLYSRNKTLIITALK